MDLRTNDVVHVQDYNSNMSRCPVLTDLKVNTLHYQSSLAQRDACSCSDHRTERL